MIKRLLVAAVLLTGVFTNAVEAQITVPNTFTTRQVISSAQMNQNFDEIELKALNRAAPVLQATLDLDVTGTYDLGTSAHKFRDLWLSRNASIGGTLGVTGAATFSSTVATGALTVTGTATATTFSGSGASLTSIPASQLAGTIANAVQDAITRTGTVTSGTWSGLFGAVSGANLTSLTAANLSGTIPAATLAGRSLADLGTRAVANLSDGANVVLLNATNTFSGATPIVLGATSKGQFRTDQAGYFTLQGGTSGYSWQNNANSAALMVLTDGGALTVNGFGTHSITSAGVGNQALVVANTSSGATNAALVRATAGTTVAQLQAYSQGYTTGTYDVQAAASLLGNGPGGMSIVATDAAGVQRFYTNGISTPQATLNSTGLQLAGGFGGGYATGTLAAGNNNNKSVGAAMVYVISGAPAGTATITGISGGWAGRLLWLVNEQTGANADITVSFGDGLSSAANQIVVIPGNGLTAGTTSISSRNKALLIYDGTQWLYIG